MSTSLATNQSSSLGRVYICLVGTFRHTRSCSMKSEHLFLIGHLRHPIRIHILRDRQID